MKLRQRQVEFRDRCLAALGDKGNTLGVAPTGAGKCLGRGTPVLMYDGTIKAVEDVTPHDLLMGPDSTPRRVLSTTSGIGPLYKVIPNKGEAYVVNDAHILSLKMTKGTRCKKWPDGSVQNISVMDYLASTPHFRHCAKGWRTGVDFAPAGNELPIPPYILGVWLGDGTARSPAITTPDPEIHAAFEQYARSIGLMTRIEAMPNNQAWTVHATSGEKACNPFRSALRSLGLLQNKHIPAQYLTASREDRLQLLAGLIDTDGYTAKQCFDVVFKQEELARGLVFLARSLGFAAYIKPCRKTATNTGATGDYWRTCISGDVGIVPLRVPRRQPDGERKINKDPLITGIRVEPIGEGEYFGFEITGDRLFLLGDFTVTHNTVMLSAITGEYVNQGASALVIQHRDELVTQNRDTFEAVNPRATTGLFTADRKEWGYGATFAMIQTLAREKNLESMPPFDIMAIDEGHHAAADSYLRTIDAGFKRNQNMKLLLVTATPNRGDKKALRGVVDNVADQISLKELIDARLLVPPRSFVIDIGVREELRGVRKLASDYDMSAVEAIMDKQVLNERIVEEWGKVAGDRPTVVFCSTVAHAQHVAEAFRSAGIRAATIYGDMPDHERRGTLEAYDQGDIQVITNVAVLTEGWDHQPTSCVILLRPSSFKSTMIQMIGRGLRKVDPERYPGVHKDDCIVLDFGTSLLQHGSLEQDVNLDQEGTKDCPECAAVVPAQCSECPICGYAWPKPPAEDTEPALPGMEDDVESLGQQKALLTDFVMSEIDLLADSPFRYENLFGGLVCIATALDAWVAVVSYFGRWHAIGGGKMIGIKYLADSEDRLFAMASADDFLRINGDSDVGNKAKRWMSQACSDRQREFLGLNPMEAIGVTKYEAACRLEWKFNERAIRKILESGGRRMAA